MMEKIKRNAPLVIGCFIFCGIFVFFGLRNRNRLEGNHQLTIGTIYDCSNGGKAAANSIYFHYSYVVNGVAYKSSSTYSKSDIPFYVAQKYLIGKSFPVVYYLPDPSNSVIMVTPKTFKQFGYNYPDSLAWVLTYLSK